MLLARSTLQILADQLDAAPDGARWATAVVDCSPLDLVRSGGDAVAAATYFSSPDGITVGGLGVSHQVIGSGSERFSTLDRAIRASHGRAPYMTGFSFRPDGPSGVEWDGFPSALAVCPEITIVTDGAVSTLTVIPRPGSDGSSLLSLLGAMTVPERHGSVVDVVTGVEPRPSPQDWVGMVGDAVVAIEGGAIAKVVLARTVVVRSVRAMPVFELVARLQEQYTSSRVFGWQRGEHAFIGASPELLVARSGDRFRTEPLAGSAARGTTPQDDQRIGESLLASAKDRAEHAVVVDDVVARLRPLVGALEVPDQPVLLRYPTVQHLATPVSGTTTARVLEFAAALHPTPAVGGAPREAALDYIAKTEVIDRGWYAGGIGWSDASGNGEIAVGLRCALVTGSRAILYAGNGIVAGSDPAAELEETRLKLRPMLELVTGV